MKINFLVVTFLFLTTCSSLFGQEVPILEPVIGKSYDFLSKRLALWSVCDSLANSDFSNMPTQELTKLRNACEEIKYSEACNGSWSIICGSDWVDEGYNINDISRSDYKFCEVSSALNPQKDNVYNEKSISDLSYETAWVEGVEGYGIKEAITYNFPIMHPRITKVIIANGYVKNKTAWKNNARAKQLKMYVNDKPFAILNLEDVYAKQTFNIPTIGYEILYRSTNKDGTSWYKYKDTNGNIVKSYNKEINGSKEESIKFEIVSVYKGDKYKDTAITEIYFDGLDVY